MTNHELERPDPVRATPRPTRRALVTGFAGAGAAPFLAMPLEALAATPPPVSAFAAEPIRSVALSPDGTRLAWVDGAAARPKITIIGIDGTLISEVPIPGEIKIDDVYWAGQDWVLIDVGFTLKEPGQPYPDDWTRTMAYNLVARQISRIDNDAITLNLNPDTIGVIQGTPPKAIVTGVVRTSEADRERRDSRVAVNANRAFAVVAFEIELGTNRSRTLARGNGDTNAFAFSPSGEALLRFDSNLQSGVSTVFRATPGGGWAKIVEIGDGDSLSFAGLAEAGAALVFDSRDDTGNGLKKMDIASGALSDAVPGETRRIRSVIVEQSSRTLVGVMFDGLGRPVRWLVPELERVQRKLDRSFRGRTVDILSWSTDRSKLVALVNDPGKPTAILHFDNATNAASWVGAENAALAGFTFGPREVLTLKARDGLDLTAIVTFPPGQSAASRQLPVVMLPHGGPHAEDDPAFDPLAHLFAAHGMVVLQPQFRGSTGFGDAFREAGRGEWGGKMQTDLDDTLAWAVAQGFADPRRAAIVGASYGGFAALTGITKTPQLYKCAVSIAGVSDLRAFLGFVRRRYAGASNAAGLASNADRVWTSMLGLTAFDPEGLAAISPASAAGRAGGPVLLLHGRDDVVVPFEQSRIMAAELRAAGKAHRLIELPGEDHYLRKQASRELVYGEVLAFVRQHLGV